MIATLLDSRMGLGTDEKRQEPPPALYTETSRNVSEYLAIRNIRVVLGRLGGSFRFSAPELDIVADGRTIEEAWNAFLESVRGKEDAAWLAFDTGPSRPGEIAAGLDAPEDEDWAESVD